MLLARLLPAGLSLHTAACGCRAVRLQGTKRIGDSAVSLLYSACESLQLLDLTGQRSYSYVSLLEGSGVGACYLVGGFESGGVLLQSGLMLLESAVVIIHFCFKLQKARLEIDYLDRRVDQLLPLLGVEDFLCYL